MKNNRLLYLLIIILVIWNISLTATLINNQKKEESNKEEIISNTVNGFSTDLTEVTKIIKSSNVTIETDNATQSGILYSQNENNLYVLTCLHGVSDSKKINVILDSGLNLDATIYGKDVYLDLALLEVKSNLTINPIALGDSSLLKDGEFVITLGSAASKELASSVSLGLISSKLRMINNSIVYENQNYDFNTALIQLDSNVGVGYSGAGIYNMAGEMVGMICMKNDTAVFALPINEIKLVVNKILNEEEYTKYDFGLTGLFINDIENYQKNNLNIHIDENSGFYVNTCKLGTLGSTIGIKSGDIIKSINGTVINSYDDYLSVQYTNTNIFEIIVLRNNEEITLIGSIND